MTRSSTAIAAGRAPVASSRPATPTSAASGTASGTGSSASVATAPRPMVVTAAGHQAAGGRALTQASATSAATPASSSQGAATGSTDPSRTSASRANTGPLEPTAVIACTESVSTAPNTGTAEASAGISGSGRQASWARTSHAAAVQPRVAASAAPVAAVPPSSTAGTATVIVSRVAATPPSAATAVGSRRPATGSSTRREAATSARPGPAQTSSERRVLERAGERVRGQVHPGEHGGRADGVPEDLAAGAQARPRGSGQHQHGHHVDDRRRVRSRPARRRTSPTRRGR